MFTTFFNTFKATPENHETLNRANEALHERMDHMMRQANIASRIAKLEPKKSELVKIHLTIRRAIAA